MGHAGANRKFPNDTPWETMNKKLVSQFLQTPDTEQDTKED